MQCKSNLMGRKRKLAPADYPKRPTCAFFHYQHDKKVKADIFGKYPEVKTHQDYVRKSGKIWEAMGKEEKIPWKVPYLAEADEFDEKAKAFKQKTPGKFSLRAKNILSCGSEDAQLQLLKMCVICETYYLDYKISRKFYLNILFETLQVCVNAISDWTKIAHDLQQVIASIYGAHFQAQRYQPLYPYTHLPIDASEPIHLIVNRHGRSVIRLRQFETTRFCLLRDECPEEMHQFFTRCDEIRQEIKICLQVIAKEASRIAAAAKEEQERAELYFCASSI